MINSLDSGEYEKKSLNAFEGAVSSLLKEMKISHRNSVVNIDPSSRMAMILQLSEDLLPDYLEDLTSIVEETLSSDEYRDPLLVQALDSSKAILVDHFNGQYPAV